MSTGKFNVMKLTFPVALNSRMDYSLSHNETGKPTNRGTRMKVYEVRNIKPDDRYSFVRGCAVIAWVNDTYNLVVGSYKGMTYRDMLINIQVKAKYRHDLVMLKYRASEGMLRKHSGSKGL